MAEVKITVKNVVEGQGDLPKTAKNYERLNKGINTIAVSMGAVIAAGMTFKQAFDLSREGASISQLEESFELLSSSVIKIPGLLDAMTEAARVLTHRVADMLDAGLSPTMETSAAKVFATEV